jgi:hypothetical protein
MKKYSQLVATFLFWMGIVVIRGYMHVEPWEAAWWLWVGAHGIAAARFGYVLKEVHSDNSNSAAQPE